MYKLLFLTLLLISSTANAGKLNFTFSETPADFTRKLSFSESLGSEQLEYNLSYTTETKTAGDRARLRISTDYQPKATISPFVFADTGYDFLVKNWTDGGVGVSYRIGTNAFLKHKISYALLFRLSDSIFKSSWRYKATTYAGGVKIVTRLSLVGDDEFRTSTSLGQGLYKLSYSTFSAGGSFDYTYTAGLSLKI